MSVKSGEQKGQTNTLLPPLTPDEDENISAPRRPDVRDKDADRKKKKKPDGGEQYIETALPFVLPLAVNPVNAAGHAPGPSTWINLEEEGEEFSTAPNRQANFNLTSFNRRPDQEDFPYAKKVSALSYMRDPLLASDEADHGSVDDALTPAETNIVRNYNALIRLPHYIDPISGKLHVEKRPTCFDVYGFDSNARLYDGNGRAFGTHAGETPGSTKFIDQCITDMVVVKADHAVSGEQGVALGDGNDRMTALINAKIARLAGLDVTRNKPNESLDQVDPALARKVEQEWARVMKENQPQGQYSNSAAAKVGGLVKADGSLDDTPSISDRFQALAATVASHISATPVSSLPADTKSFSPAAAITRG